MRVDKRELTARVEAAILAFDQKQSKVKSPTRKNEKPEKELTEKPCLAWLRQHGFSVNIFEAKATYNPKADLWLQQSMRSGVVDCIGVDPEGLAVFIEFKAPKRLSTLRDNQRKFLIEKINSGAFASVVDSVDRLKRVYSQWQWYRSIDINDAKDFLLSEMPSPIISKNDPLFLD